MKSFFNHGVTLYNVDMKTWWFELNLLWTLLFFFGPSAASAETARVHAVLETGGMELQILELAGGGHEYSLIGQYSDLEEMKSKQFVIEHFELQSPLRYVIDIPTKEPVSTTTLTLDSGTLHQVRVGRRSEGMRVVLEFKGAGNLLASLEREEDRAIFRFHIAHLGSSSVESDPTLWSVTPEQGSSAEVVGN